MFKLWSKWWEESFWPPEHLVKIQFRLREYTVQRPQNWHRLGIFKEHKEISVVWVYQAERNVSSEIGLEIKQGVGYSIILETLWNKYQYL